MPLRTTPRERKTLSLLLLLVVLAALLWRLLVK